ncbi:MAG: adenylosuccinate synthetase [Candidatus Obscuribacterales bacterium]
MKTGKVIIGANYGDEGKGLFTDYFASQAPEDSLVIRFNGGAQAGHTVVSPDGRRHVFSHFGSGTLLGVPTFLSKFFIVNPLIFVKEYAELAQVSETPPEITIDPNAFLTTPFDMFINQTIEKQRAGKRHGSCGLGINETVTRSLRSPQYRLKSCDVLNSTGLRRRLHELKDSWFKDRLIELKLDPMEEGIQKFVNNTDRIIEEYIKDTQTLIDLATISDRIPPVRQVLFEGAQGLMLDEDRIDQFPHVTRSKTGLTNVLHLAPQFGIEKLSVTYVSRTYLTRHGAGPLEGESDWTLPDSTNIPNQFQGTLRFAPLSLPALEQNIEYDLHRAKNTGLDISADLAMTCADQVPVPDTRRMFLTLKHVSFGRTRSSVCQALSSSMR